MKLKLSGVGIVGMLALAATSMGSVGCGPGMSHRAGTYSAQDVLAAMDRELASSIPGTATLTSGTMELPESRLSLSAGEGLKSAEATDQPAAQASQTWGAPREIDTKSPYEE